MKTVQEAARRVPVLAETEVLVVGSGPGGLSAALAAAREGAQTMLVERYGSMGGNITQVSVESLAWYRHPGTVEAGGIGREFEDRAVALGGTLPEPQSVSQALDTEMFKYLADRMVAEAGVEPLLHAWCAEAIMDGPTIKGVIIESKSGRQAILAQRVIDATGDADVAWRAGAPWRMAAKKDLMGVTVSFACRGVDRDRFLEHVHAHPATYRDWASDTTGKEDTMFSPYLEEPFKQAQQAGEIPPGVSIAGTWSRLTDEGEATYLNMVYMLGFNCTDVRDLTRGEIEGRQQAIWAIEALKKYVPGFEKASLRNFSSTLGTRESRKILGAYDLTGEDVRHEGRFADSIGIFPEFLDAYGVVIIPTTGRYFQVPYGCVVPQKVENLLVAGRAVAGDQMSHAATRQMMCCAVTGQGAGVAAAQSIRQGVSCRQVDIAQVRRALVKQGVRVD